MRALRARYEKRGSSPIRSLALFENRTASWQATMLACVGALTSPINFDSIYTEEIAVENFPF